MFYIQMQGNPKRVLLGWSTPRSLYKTMEVLISQHEIPTLLLDKSKATHIFLYFSLFSLWKTYLTSLYTIHTRTSMSNNTLEQYRISSDIGLSTTNRLSKTMKVLISQHEFQVYINSMKNPTQILVLEKVIWILKHPFN